MVIIQRESWSCAHAPGSFLRRYTHTHPLLRHSKRQSLAGWLAHSLTGGNGLPEPGPRVHGHCVRYVTAVNRRTDSRLLLPLLFLSCGARYLRIRCSLAEALSRAAESMSR